MNGQKRYDQYMYSYPHKRAYYPLPATTVREAVERIPEGEELTLYLHVPFCSGKCGYCNLFSVVCSDESLTENYVLAVLRQMEQYGKAVADRNIKVGHVVLGGGTPFILSVSQLERLFDGLEQMFRFSLKNCGFDIETSPDETTEEKLCFLLKRGMQRLSIGIQSLHPEELEKLKRKHKVQSCLTALDRISGVRPSCLNLDFIYGIPGQTEQSFLSSLEKGLTYQPDELFLYPLYVRKETPLFGETVADQDIQYELYQAAAGYLADRGYTQTSMRRFSKAAPGAVKSCGFEQMLAFGCGGRSYLGSVHFCEPYQVSGKACRSILETYIGKSDFFDGMNGYILDPDEQMRRFVIKNLGYFQGVSKQEFAQRFGMELTEVYGERWSELEQDGFVRQVGDHVLLTANGLGDSDRILALWISEKVAKGMNRC